MSYKTKATIGFSTFILFTVLYVLFGGETEMGEETPIGAMMVILGMIGWFYGFWALGKHKNRNGWLVMLLGLLSFFGLIILLLIPTKKIGVDKVRKNRKFKFCGTGIGFGLLAIVVTIPIWGIFGPIFLSSFSPLLTDIILVSIPVTAFTIVLWKICSTDSGDTKDTSNP